MARERSSALPTLEGALAGHERMFHLADAGKPRRSRVGANGMLKLRFVARYV
jgi:hypothetical protein